MAEDTTAPDTNAAERGPGADSRDRATQDKVQNSNVLDEFAEDCAKSQRQSEVKQQQQDTLFKLAMEDSVRKKEIHQARMAEMARTGESAKITSRTH